MTSEIVPLSLVRVTPRCPECVNPFIARTAEPQSSRVSMNGAALYVVREICSMCGWETSTRNVKLGA